jgi:hypothetical protein
LHKQWFETAVLIAYGLGACTIWRRNSRGRAVKGIALAVMGVAGLVHWKPEWLAVVALAPAVIAVVIGLLMERDEDIARAAADQAQEALETTERPEVR